MAAVAGSPMDSILQSQRGHPLSGHGQSASASESSGIGLSDHVSALVRNQELLLGKRESTLRGVLQQSRFPLPLVDMYTLKFASDIANLTDESSSGLIESPNYGVANARSPPGSSERKAVDLWSEELGIDSALLSRFLVNQVDLQCVDQLISEQELASPSGAKEGGEEGSLAQGVCERSGMEVDCGVPEDDAVAAPFRSSCMSSELWDQDRREAQRQRATQQLRSPTGLFGKKNARGSSLNPTADSSKSISLTKTQIALQGCFICKMFNRVTCSTCTPTKLRSTGRAIVRMETAKLYREMLKSWHFKDAERDQCVPGAVICQTCMNDFFRAKAPQKRGQHRVAEVAALHAHVNSADIEDGVWERSHILAVSELMRKKFGTFQLGRDAKEAGVIATTMSLVDDVQKGLARKLAMYYQSATEYRRGDKEPSDNAYRLAGIRVLMDVVALSQRPATDFGKVVVGVMKAEGVPRTAAEDLARAVGLETSVSATDKNAKKLITQHEERMRKDIGSGDSGYALCVDDFTARVEMVKRVQDDQPLSKAIVCATGVAQRLPSQYMIPRTPDTSLVPPNLVTPAALKHAATSSVATMTTPVASSDWVRSVCAAAPKGEGESRGQIPAYDMPSQEDRLSYHGLRDVLLLMVLVGNHLKTVKDGHQAWERVAEYLLGHLQGHHAVASGDFYGFLHALRFHANQAQDPAQDRAYDGLIPFPPELHADLNLVESVYLTYHPYLDFLWKRAVKYEDLPGNPNSRRRAVILEYVATNVMNISKDDLLTKALGPTAAHDIRIVKSIPMHALLTFLFDRVPLAWAYYQAIRSDKLELAEEAHLRALIAYICQHKPNYIQAEAYYFSLLDHVRALERKGNESAIAFLKLLRESYHSVSERKIELIHCRYRQHVLHCRNGADVRVTMLYGEAVKDGREALARDVLYRRGRQQHKRLEELLDPAMTEKFMTAIVELVQRTAAQADASNSAQLKFDHWCLKSPDVGKLTALELTFSFSGSSDMVQPPSNSPQLSGNPRAPVGESPIPDAPTKRKSKRQRTATVRVKEGEEDKEREAAAKEKETVQKLRNGTAMSLVSTYDAEKHLEESSYLGGGKAVFIPVRMLGMGFQGLTCGKDIVQNHEDFGAELCRAPLPGRCDKCKTAMTLADGVLLGCNHSYHSGCAPNTCQECVRIETAYLNVAAELLPSRVEPSLIALHVGAIKSKQDAVEKLGRYGETAPAKAKLDDLKNQLQSAIRKKLQKDEEGGFLDEVGNTGDESDEEGDNQ